MLHLIIFLLLATVLKQSLGQNYSVIVNDVPEKVQEEIVKRHNDIRRGVVPTASNMLKMQWDTEASKSAKAWARKCLPNAGPKSERQVNGILCGQNVWGGNYIGSWEETIKRWNSTVSNFKYGLGAIDKKKDIYSYTQLVWYNSNLLGCAIALCPDFAHKYVYVCNYCPEGNQVEKAPKPYKEGPSCGDCPSHCENKLCTNPCKYHDKDDNCKALIRLFSCKNANINKKCSGTCKCKTEII